MKRIVRFDARGFLKALVAFVLVATQCLTATPGIRVRAQSPPSVDLPSLAGKSMGDIIQQIKSSKKRCREVSKELLARVPSGAPPFDDLCYFKIEPGRLAVFTYRGRAVAFQYLFGLKGPTEPEEALRRVGINVNGAKPQIQEDPPGGVRNYVWSGTFNERSWKEIIVMQFLKMNQKSGVVVAILSDKAE